MSVKSTSTRRILTVVAVAASLLIGVGAIRASAAWTASASPLDMAPVSAETLQARLADESARSAALVDRLTALTLHADELSAALASAEARIGSDAEHAARLAEDLAAAKKKLAALEKSIRQASRARAVAPAPATVASGGSSHDDEDEDHEDEEDHEDDD
jgi:chromosome segregation ATPase